jgi:hypothetical protein
MNKAWRVPDYLGLILAAIERHTADVDAAFAEANGEIPWQVMYAMRNRLSHGYDQVGFDMVWKTICNDLPDLYKLVKAASNELRRPRGAVYQGDGNHTAHGCSPDGRTPQGAGNLPALIEKSWSCNGVMNMCP